MNNTIQKSVDYKVLTKVTQSEPKVTVEEVRSDGDVIFSVPLSDLGLKPETVLGNLVVDTGFFQNFVGEYIVRKNIDQFDALLAGIDAGAYENMVCANEHTDFGMVASKDTVRFSMHISLVQKILTEDFREALES